MILVAGGTGRLGSAVVAALVERKERVRVLTRRRTLGPYGGVEVAVGDVRDPGSLGPALDGVERVVAAVHGFVGDGSPDSVDRQGVANLVDAAKAVGASVVLVSVVGAAPDSPFELFRAKHAGEAYLRASGVPCTIVRATAFAETWLQILRETAGASGRPLVFGRGDNPIDFVAAGDVAALVVHAATSPPRGEILEIGGETLTMNALAAQLGRPRHLPRLALRLGATMLAPFRPGLARQMAAAVTMDTAPLRFSGPDARARFTDLPRTPIASS